MRRRRTKDGEACISFAKPDTAASWGNALRTSTPSTRRQALEANLTGKS